eukprot:852997-Pyramimonas_sp.AAC.1
MIRYKVFVRRILANLEYNIQRHYIRGKAVLEKWGTGHRVREGKGLRGVECTLAVIGTGGPANNDVTI